MTFRQPVSVSSDTIGKTLDQWIAEKGRLVHNPIWTLRIDQQSSTHRRLAVDMGSPGRGWIVFEWANHVLKCTLIFDPQPILGLLYWALLWPGHRLGVPLLLSHLTHRMELPS
jgi:hypothetical protein